MIELSWDSRPGIKQETNQRAPAGTSLLVWGAKRWKDEGWREWGVTCLYGIISVVPPLPGSEPQRTWGTKSYSICMLPSESRCLEKLTIQILREETSKSLMDRMFIF